jgi:chaperonin GroES
VSDPQLEIQMLLDRILVRISPEDGERRSTGGIVIPATAQVAKRLSWGNVLGVGNNVRLVKVGDRGRSATGCCSTRTTSSKWRSRATSTW